MVETLEVVVVSTLDTDVEERSVVVETSEVVVVSILDTDVEDNSVVVETSDVVDTGGPGTLKHHRGEVPQLSQFEIVTMDEDSINLVMNPFASVVKPKISPF